jgi:ATP-binding cassette subfamily B protein/subfamily B ATP-binding cassette protein MsbA
LWQGDARRDRPGIGYLLRYATRSWRGWILVLALTLLSSGITLLQPWPMQLVVDHVLGGSELAPGLAHLLGPIGGNSRHGLLLIAPLGGVVIFALGSLVETALTFSWIRVGQKTVYDLMADLFAHLERRGLAFHARNSVGDSMSRINGDSWCIYGIIENLLFTPLHAVVMIASITLVMARIDVTLTLLALAIAPVMAAASFLRRKPVRVATKRRREVESSIFAHVQQVLSGISVVQAFSQEQRERERFEEYAAAAIRAQQRGAVATSVSNLAVGLAAVLGNGCILFVGANRVASGHLGLGTLLVLLAYLATLQGQMKSLANAYLQWQTLRPSMDRVLELMEPDPVSDAPGARGIERARGHVVFSNVTFGYDAERPVVQDITLEARPGETVAIVGATGAGKSTLAGLVARFFDPSAGQVLLDGVDLRELRLVDLRRQIGMVLQEPFLFPRTVAENIAYGRREATREQIVAAATTADAHEFIIQLPLGYDTVIGERGATLSGGQRQRLSIARALLKDAPVLILDEPTSALDAATEARLLAALERLMAGRTTFIIAHRLSTIRKADRIVVLENGRIAESGTHADLLAEGGVYSRLYQAQAATPISAGAGAP